MTASPRPDAVASIDDQQSVANVGYVTPSFPRELTELERSLLDRLLAEEFPGANELRVQAQAVRVKGYGDDVPSILLLEVVDDHAPRASVVHTVPVETRVRDAEPPQELLLFVTDGLLDSLELVDYGLSEPGTLPLMEELEPPVVNARNMAEDEERVSLDPLTGEEALRALLKVDPDSQPATRRRPATGRT
jgi:hypothetical protein